MTSNELADEVRNYIEACTKRITGPGAEQYELEDTQHFESMPLKELFTYLDEELQDIANYACMLHIRLGWLKRELNDYVQAKQ